MKNVFKTSLLILLVALFFSSCHNKSGLALTKRHYRSGYFVEFGNKKSTPLVVKKKQESAEAPKVSLSSTQAQPRLNEANEKSTDQEPILTPLNASESAKGKGIFSGHVKNVSTNRHERSVPIREVKDTSHTETVSGADRAGDALSFLWLVCIILLVIWLIALLTGGWGIGGLIHLILVVAVILFVLWLLKII